MATLNPEDFNYFRQQKRRVKTTYDLGRDQNAYQQDVLKRTWGRQEGDLVRQFDRMRERMPWGYAARGLMNSGIWQKAQDTWATDRTRALGNLQGQFQDQLGGLQLASGQLDRLYEEGGKDIDDAMRARLDAVAAALSAALGR